VSIVEAKEFGCEQLAHGELRQVWICKKAIKDFRKADKIMLKRVAKIIEKYCDYERAALGPTQFKQVRRDAKAGKKIALKEFKADQLRLYGIEETIAGNEMFIIVTVDTAKKRNKADSRKITTALSKSWEYINKIGVYHGEN